MANQEIQMLVPASVESRNLERGINDNERPDQAAVRVGPWTEVSVVITQLNTVVNRLAQIEQTDMLNQQTEAVQQTAKFTELGRKIYNAAIDNDWNSVSSDFENDLGQLKAKISYGGETALCVAVGTNKSNDFVERIVEKIMTTDEKWETLRFKNGKNEENALHVAARLGNVNAARFLVSKDPELPQLRSKLGDTPLSIAAWGKNVEMLEYLLTVTKDVDEESGSSPFRGHHGALVLGRSISAGHLRKS